MPYSHGRKSVLRKLLAKLRALFSSDLCSCEAPFNQFLKLRPIGLPNQIAKDWDSKPSKFDRQYQSDSKSDKEIVS